MEERRTILRRTQENQAQRLVKKASSPNAKPSTQRHGRENQDLRNKRVKRGQFDGPQELAGQGAPQKPATSCPRMPVLEVVVSVGPASHPNHLQFSNYLINYRAQHCPSRHGFQTVASYLLLHRTHHHFRCQPLGS